MENSTLALTSHNPETDAVMTARSLPALTGNGQSDLHCGGCGEVLAKAITTEAIAHAFETDRRLLLQCTCGAHNLVSEAKAAPASN